MDLTEDLRIMFTVGRCPYQDTFTSQGIPNFRELLPRVYRCGLPPTPEAWMELRDLVEVPGSPVTRVALHDRHEGDESAPLSFGWRLIWVPLPPEEDRPLTVFTKPAHVDVDHVVDEIVAAYNRGETVVFGCVHGRDRTGLIAGLVGVRLLGWSKEQAWQYAVATGLRWELPGLDAYWLEDVP